MKKLLCAFFAVTLLLCGCAKAPAEKKPESELPSGATIELPTSGVGDAVVPEDGDIVIPINP